MKPRILRSTCQAAQALRAGGSSSLRPEGLRLRGGLRDERDLPGGGSFTLFVPICAHWSASSYAVCSDDVSRWRCFTACA